MPNTNTPSVHQLKRALDLSEQIAKLEGQLSAILNSSSAAASPARALGAAPAEKKTRRRRRKGKLSPEARERIAAAQRARWAKTKGTKATADKPAALTKTGKRRKKRRAISPEARAKMAEAARRRWAAIKKS